MQDPIESPARLYIVVRGDLGSGLLAAQAVHAAFAFADEHPTLFTEWLETSNFLVIVAARDEAHLIQISQKAHDLRIPFSSVDEPDLNGEMTALTLAPSLESKKLCSSLPLALREAAMV